MVQVVQIKLGRSGASPALVAAMQNAWRQHEVVKLRIHDDKVGLVCVWLRGCGVCAASLWRLLSTGSSSLTHQAPVLTLLHRLTTQRHT